MGLNRTKLFILFTVIIVVLAFIFYPQNKLVPLQKGAVIVLPVKSEISAHDGLWQQYANQESIIVQLQQSNLHPILQVEDVINFLMQSDSYIEDTRPLQLNDLLTKSGAALVVESQLTKAVEQYQLKYHFYGPKLQLSGQLAAKDVDALFSDLANLINQQTAAATSNNKPFNTKYFNNEQLILALQQLQFSSTDNAEEILNSLSTSQQNNLIAQRQRAEIALKKSEFSDAQQILTSALLQAELIKDRSQSARLGLTLAKSYIEQKELPQALSTLSQSRTHAANAQDWLYLAYIAAWAGHVNQRLGRYEAANQQYQLSVDYHKIVGNQAGQVVALNKLAQLAVLEYNYSTAYKYINQSVAIVTQKQLESLKPETMALLAKVENKLQGT